MATTIRENSYVMVSDVERERIRDKLLSYALRSILYLRVETRHSITQLANVIGEDPRAVRAVLWNMEFKNVPWEVAPRRRTRVLEQGVEDMHRALEEFDVSGGDEDDAGRLPTPAEEDDPSKHPDFGKLGD